MNTIQKKGEKAIFQMEASDMSASSCFTDNEDNSEIEKMNVIDAQKLQLENNYLKEENEGLKVALEETKKQLNQALEAAASNQNIRDQIQSLSQQLNQANIEKERAINELSIYKQNADSFSSDSSLSAANSPENITSRLELQKKLKKAKDNLRKLINENNAQKQIIDGFQLTQAKMEKRKAKLKENLKNLLTKIKDQENEINKLKDIKNKLEAEQKAVIQENENLKDQNTTYMALSNEAKGTVENLNKELLKQKNANSKFAQLLENQRAEIAKYSDERHEFITLFYSLMRCASSSDSKIDDILKENEDLLKKLKSARGSNDEDKINLSETDIPFDGELKTKCMKILLINQYLPSVRIQMIFNEINQYIRQLTDQLNSTIRESEDIRAQFNIERNGAEKYREMMRSLLKELRNISLTDEKINTTAFCDEDRRFIDFMGEQSNYIEPQIASDSDLTLSPGSSMNTRFYPYNFFGVDDTLQNQQVIRREIKPSEEAFSLFTAQFLLNALLKQRLNKLMEASVKKDELESIIQQINGGSLSDLPKLLDSFKYQLLRNKSSLKRERDTFKKMQKELIERNKELNETKILANKLKIQNDVLTNKCDLLKVQVDTASNELLMRSASNDGPTQSIIASPDHSQFKKEIAKKREEIRTLRQTLNNMQLEMTQIQKQKSKSSKRNEEELRDQIAQLQQSLQEALEDNSNLKKKLKKAKKVFIKKVEESAQEYQKKFDESKQSFDEVANTMKEKQKQSHELNDKLLQSLKEREEINQKCQNENIDLQNENKTLQNKMVSMQESITKERQQLKNQMAALQLACDSKCQELLRSTKQTIQNEKEKLFSIMVNGLSSVYKIDCAQFDDDSFARLVDQLKKDIEKLRFFQNASQIV